MGSDDLMVHFWLWWKALSKADWITRSLRMLSLAAGVPPVVVNLHWHLSWDAVYCATRQSPSHLVFLFPLHRGW